MGHQSEGWATNVRDGSPTGWVTNLRGWATIMRDGPPICGMGHHYAGWATNLSTDRSDNLSDKSNNLSDRSDNLSDKSDNLSDRSGNLFLPKWRTLGMPTLCHRQTANI